jgi:hypothetical protein
MSLSQPGTKAGITSGSAERLLVPPRLEGRGIHMGREAVVLTLVATGRSAGVSEVWWCGSSAGRKTKVVARRRGRTGSRGTRCSRRRRVRLLPRAAPVFAADGSPTDGSSPPPSPFTPLLLRRVGVSGLGSNSPEAARVGSCLGGLGGGLNSGAARDTRTAGMRRGSVGHAATVRPAAGAPLSLWASAKVGGRGDEVASAWPWVTQFGGPLCSDRAARAVGGDGGGRLLGRGWAESGAGLDRRLAAC